MKKKRFQDAPFTKNRAKYTKYTKEALDTMINQLFEGGSGPTGKTKE
jgi:chemotaxis receptor (MCP) glutamine deamidase CheD